MYQWKYQDALQFQRPKIEQENNREKGLTIKKIKKSSQSENVIEHDFDLLWIMNIIISEKDFYYFRNYT